MTVLASRWLAISIHAKSGCCTTSWRDRKSTRLNSSHSQISYAVFCLKKKKNHIPPPFHHYTIHPTAPPPPHTFLPSYNVPCAHTVNYPVCVSCCIIHPHVRAWRTLID